MSSVLRLWESFSDAKRVLYRNILLLGLVVFAVSYQIIAVELFVEEQSVCNATGQCIYTKDWRGNESVISITYKEVDFEDSGRLLVTSHYISMMVGMLALGVLADKYGRHRVLFCSLISSFCSSLLGGVLIHSIPAFVTFMIINGFTSGISMLIVFILVAEYVNPGRRPVVLVSIWLSSTLSCISFAGLAYALESRRILMIVISLPLFMAILLFNFIPESPRWTFLHSTYNAEEETQESQKLLNRFVSEEQSQVQPKGCWHCDGPGEGTGESCFQFLKKKEPRKTVIIVVQAWFSIGMLYRALNMSSVQLLKNFYVNYAVRELINIPAFICHVLFVTCAGRRITTLLSMVFSGVVCLIFAAASDGFFLSENHSTTLVIQLVGRFFVVLSMTSLAIYSIELFPTTARCTAVGLVTSASFLGAAVAPLFMELQSINPIVPLGIVGSFSLLSGVLLRLFLPETRGSMTSETFEDTVVGRRDFNKPWSPKVHMRRHRYVDDDSMSVDSPPAADLSPPAASSPPIAIDESVDEYKDLRHSWEVSFDRASRHSKWEWLSYEDAQRKLPSLDIELSLQDESRILDEQDLDKLLVEAPGTTWILLYSTYQHGISLTTLYHRLRTVETSILLAIKDSNGYVFGVYSPTTPRIIPGFHGYGKSFFFTCRPRYKVYPCSGKNEYYLNCNVDSLAFGCSDGLFGLWLDSELYRGRSTACETYNSEMLSATEDFICIGLEAWTFA